MNWIMEMHRTQPVAHAVGVLSCVCVLGMALGSLRFRGVGLGTAGVLFAGIVLGHFGQPVDHATLEFVKEFGLILFVFTMGLQLGPGFFATLRAQGLRQNILAAVVVVMGAVLAPLAGWLAGFDPEAVLGVFAGASVNIPALGAATQTLGTLPGVSAEQIALPALACAVTYPPAILGVIGTLLLLKAVFRIDPAAESAEYVARNQRPRGALIRRTLVVANPRLDGLTLDEIPGRIEAGITVSRVRHDGQTVAAAGSIRVHLGDEMSVVGEAAGVERFERVVGGSSPEDLALEENSLTFRRVVVTRRDVLGKSVGELQLDDRFEVAVTRLTRADLEMSAVPGLRLQFGDQLQIVGTSESLDRASQALGNSLKELNETHFVPFFIGIALGIVLGTLPIQFPGLPQPVRLGLAGGPLIVALILGRIGRIGRQVWHMPVNTNLAFREFGIALFFAAVGLQAGEKFFSTAFSPLGAQWLLAGIVVTIVPMLVVGAFARGVWKMNFAELSGLLAGSSTNPPALSFANGLTGSVVPSVAYATVYPLTTLLRILGAQVLALMLCS